MVRENIKTPIIEIKICTIYANCIIYLRPQMYDLYRVCACKRFETFTWSFPATQGPLKTDVGFAYWKGIFNRITEAFTILDECDPQFQPACANNIAKIVRIYITYY